MKTKFLLSAIATVILAFGFTTANAATIKHEGSKATVKTVNMHKENKPQKKHHHRHHRKHHRLMKHK